MILKLKRTPGIYLVGFMACGKSTIGRLLADELGWNFADLDEDIEAETKLSINEIFETLGEQAFRNMETEGILKRVRMVERGRPTVLALGGGAFIREENYRLLTEHGVTIWIDCPFDIICHRVAHSTHRPLARDTEKMRQLYDIRRELYARAEYHVETRGDSAEVAQQILKLGIL